MNSTPIPAQQFRTEAPLIKSTSLGGWQNEFMRQRSGAGTPTALGKQVVREAPQMNTFQSSAMMNYTQPMYHSHTNGFQQEPQMQQQNMQQDHQVSDVDFDAAFADALAHAQKMDQDRAHQIEAQLQPDPVEVQQLEQTENIKIGSDALRYVEKQDRTVEPNTRDADELARTAGELLNSVSHDQSDKFQNSQFLNLMRKIRDREVEVQNNDLQDKSTGLATSEMSRMEETQQGPGTASETNTTSHFEFPDMDTVYAPFADTNTDDVWSEAADRYVANAQFGPSPYTTYGFDDDQYPQSQMEALHPGGKFYPDQSPRVARAEMAEEVEMSGAVPPVSGGGNTVEDGARLEKRISASDFDYLDESAGLARRFVRRSEMEV